MEKSFPFNAVTVDGIPDRVYAAEDFAAERAAYVSNGVTAEGALAVSPSASGGMAVDIAAGIAVIDGYTYFNTSPLTLEIPAADGSLPRVDLAVLRLDLEARKMYCRIVSGIPAATPAAPAVVWDETVREMPLVRMDIPAGAVSAETVLLTDLRIRADYILNRLDVEAILARYEAAIADFFDTEDAASLAKGASVLKTDAGADTVLCGDGMYRPAVTVGEKREELVRFTVSGVFDPAAYPTRDGKYDVILVGGGGSGAWGSAANRSYGGEAGGVRVLAGLPLLAGTVYQVTVGTGGSGVRVDPGSTSAKNGMDGGRTYFAGFYAAGGQGGECGALSSYTGIPTQENGYTHNLGTTGASGRGGDSLLAEGGRNNMSGQGNPGSLGSGGGACYKSGNDGTYYSGKGGDGVVIICGVRA